MSLSDNTKSLQSILETVNNLPDKEEWTLVQDTTLDANTTINLGSMSNAKEMLFLCSSPVTEAAISTGAASYAFGSRIHDAAITSTTYIRNFMIYAIRAGEISIAFFRGYDSNDTTPSIDATRRTEGNLYCAQSGSSNDVPLTIGNALPAGTIVKIYIK